ncbi:MAG TPA: hypothetical protein VMW83_11390 [Spirochaetia bacterium]|nr:hypothetical protein [Spirochaetia bacterium]
MSYHVIKWKQWPFPKGRAVTLHWVQSPFMEPASRQWRTNAVFLDGQNLVNVEVPWGALPFLRCGHVYRDGSPLPNRVSDHNIIDLRHGPSIITEEAGSVISRSLLYLGTRANLAEKCWLFSITNGQRVIIPVIEGIRTLIAPTRYLALRCLEPAFLKEIVRYHRMDRDKLWIRFSEEIPLRLLTKGMVLQLGRLLLLPDFRSAWDAIYYGLQQPTTARSSFPPKVDVPMPKVVRMVVRGHFIGDTFLVREIVQAETTCLTISTILWSHPRLEKEGDVVQSKWRRVRAPRRQLEIDRFSAASGNASFHVDAISALGEWQRITIHRVPMSLQTRKRWRQIAGPSLTFSVSVADVGPGVKRSSIDIALHSSEPGTWPTTNPEDGLDEFFSMLRYLRKKFNGSIDVIVMDFPGSTPFSRIDDRKRKMVKLNLFWITGKNVTILEFGCPDFHHISTLIHRGDGKDKCTNELFSNVLSANGSWNRQALLYEFGDEGFYLLRHSRRSEDRWAALLLGRADEVER